MSELGETSAVLPQHFFCALSNVLMTDPVTARNGETYDRAAIERLFARSKKNKSRQGSSAAQLLSVLTDRTLVPNVFAMQTIRDAAETRADGGAAPTEAPNNFKCPITHELLEDPVLCSDGHTYERVAVELLINGFLDKAAVDDNARLLSPMLGSPLVDMVLLPNLFARQTIAEFSLQHPHLVTRDTGALEDYRRWKREREERAAEEEAEEGEDRRLEELWRPFIMSNRTESVLHPSPFPEELGAIHVAEVPRINGQGTDMYFVTGDRRVNVAPGQQFPMITLRSLNELTKYLIEINYYPGRRQEFSEVKRRLEREPMLKKMFEPEKFAGRGMICRWDDGVWYAVVGQEVIVPARRVIVRYVECDEVEEMSYKAFCKLWRKRQVEILDPTEDPVHAASSKNARARGREAAA